MEVYNITLLEAEATYSLLSPQTSIPTSCDDHELAICVLLDASWARICLCKHYMLCMYINHYVN